MGKKSCAQIGTQAKIANMLKWGCGASNQIFDIVENIDGKQKGFIWLSANGYQANMAVCEIFMRTFCVFFCFCAVFSCVLFHNVIGCSPQKMEKKTLLAAPKNRPVFGPNNGLKSLKPPCLCLFCFGPFSGAVFRTDFWGPHGTVCMRRSQTRIDPMCDCIV